MLIENKKYLTTTEVKKILKISDCEVMHLRQSGKVSFTKKGNAYLYLEKDIIKIKS